MPTAEDGSVAAPAGMTLDSPMVYTGLDMEQAVEAAAPEAAVVFTRDAGQSAVGVNTTTTLQTRISGACPPLRGGTYKVTISYLWSNDSQTGDFESTFTWGGASISGRSDGVLHKQEPKDAAGSSSDGTGTDQGHGFTHVSVVSVAAGASPTVLLEWRTTIGGVEAAIWNSTVIVERLGP